MARLDRIDRPVAGRTVSGREDVIYRHRARRLGLPFASAVDLGRHPPAPAEVIARGTFALSAARDRAAFIAPDEETLPAIGRWLIAYPQARRRLSVATPSAIRAALRRASATDFASDAIDRLSRLDPEMSSRRTLTRSQLGIGLGLIAAITASTACWPVPSLVALNLFAAAFFFGVAVLRFLAAHLVPGALAGPDLGERRSDGALPVYTVLVPLHHEEHIVAQLHAALERLDWPADRRDVKLIVEADDVATRAAVAQTFDGPPYEIVVVPAGLPRTKPKALAYAMTFARGDYVTIYDAEDLPHPGQLREAFAAFGNAGADVACLQAPIIVEDPAVSLMTRLFSIEYAALFDGLLPALAALRLPLPLGGTSNHFRRGALERVGGWNPFNVTEDADLGIRLARFGYRSATLTLPTWEEAPATLGAWLRQRTRWFKGWMQTWLVHMRHPLLLVRQIGLRGFVGFNLIGAGMLISALIHPIYLATLVIVAANPLALWDEAGAFGAAVIGINLFNLIAGYLSVAMLTSRALALRGRSHELPALIGMPFYWLLMAAACMRALVQLVARPHHWEKTPHVGRPRPAGPAPRFSLSPQVGGGRGREPG